MAEALVGGAFLSATLQVLFDRLASRDFINFFRGRNHDDRLLRKLKLKLLGLNKVLNDAEEKQITDQAVKDWLEELKDAVYHADDLLDEIATEALRCKVEAEYPSGTNQVQAQISTSTSAFDAEIESKLEKIIDLLEDIAKEKDVLGLREVVGQNWSHRVPTTSLVDKEGVYGRDDDMEDIMELLLSDGGRSNVFDVIPIVGMGGLGKTTLAQLLYNNVRVVKHFDVKAWVCVSDVFDIFRITRTILEEVTQKPCHEKDLNRVQVKLKESLSGRTFLIVLDDVWNEKYDDWDVLTTPFKNGGHGSRIIVTTRNESVASIMQTVSIHRLQELQHEDCWKLFAKHAFDRGDCRSYPNLQGLGNQIVEKCKGLPLAAKTLGGLLRSTRNVDNWKNILNSSIWELPEKNSYILPALRLSYHYLPPHLKRCFAYCSVFPHDYQFDKEELVLIWIAVGIVEKPRNNKTIEEEGYKYFQELLSRSFFQRSSEDTSRFVMHDLLNDLAHFVSRAFCYRLEDDRADTISAKVRDLSIAHCRFDGFKKLKVVKEAKFLRTFMSLKSQSVRKQWISKKVLEEILPRLTRLRLLSLPKYELLELPHSIGNLIHLRYLDLSDTPIKQLPESVCTLFNLQTLLLSNCRHLTTLPPEIGKLIELRHLDLSGTNLKEMPMHMSQLKDLRDLSVFVVGKCSGSDITELKEFHHLRGTIAISSLENVTSGSNALEAKMREKKHLEKLVLEWGGSTENSANERDVLDKVQPHTNLKHLQIKNYGGTRFPNWLGDQLFCNMVSVCLENCEHCFSLPPLGQMPSLKELTISRMKGITNVGCEFYRESGSLGTPFQSLETLRFEEMLEWVDWHVLDAGEFSSLRKLELIKCPKLIRDLPKHVPSLVRLEIKECPELVASLPRTASPRDLVLEGCGGISLGWQGVCSLEKLVISHFPGLEIMTSRLFTPTNLKELKISECPSLVSFPDTVLPPVLTNLQIYNCEAMQCFSQGMMRLNNLKELDVRRCPKLVFPLSEEMRHCCASLENLSLSGFDSLISLPLGLFPKVRFLYIYDCENFETLSIPNGLEPQNNLTSLDILSISGCNMVVSFPSGGLRAPNLSYIQICGCKGLKALPEQMCTLLPALRSLKLIYCPEIESFPEGGLPSKLSYLQIERCRKLLACRRDWGLQKLTSLICFAVSGESEDLLESFPEEGLLPSTLTSLVIYSMPNLKSLNYRGLQHLGDLKYMDISKCLLLESLPEEGLPTSLFLLEIDDCPLLEPRCRREEGLDWHKIAQVPVVNMDFRMIFEQEYLGPIPDDHQFSDLRCPGWLLSSA